jgi:hypothetical protein
VKSQTQTDLLEQRITLPELERAIRTSDPRALLILPRILRRVIKQDRELTGFAFRVPHRKCYIIDRQKLLAIVEPDEIGLDHETIPPDKLILLAQPDPQKLLAIPAGEALVKCWRLLFHARIHLAVGQRIAEGALNESVLRRRISQIGKVEFDEIRTVLGQEGFLLPPRNDQNVYEEFAALFFEFKYFAPNALPRYFPTLQDLDAQAAVLGQDVDAQWLYITTRPVNAPDPADDSIAGDQELEIGDAETLPSSAPRRKEPPSEAKYRKLMRKAQRPDAMGNVVGAAIYRVQALHCAPQEMASRTINVLKGDVNRLIVRLQTALEPAGEAPQPWHDSLRALVLLSGDGFWTPEARLLYDLQKVCVAHEREISTVNIAEWLFSFGRRPIKRPLPNQRDVLASQHLRSAQRRLAAVRLAETQRKQLGSLLQAAMERVENRLRRQFRPLIAGALDAVGLKPAYLPEQVAQKKIVEELLDRVVERGFLSLGDLRDALSRNALKMPDIAGPGTLISGDPLLQADHRLGELLDGVYRPAEFYLRWMQQLSSLAFGTRIGRFLTLNIAVPFGGAFLIQKGLDHLLGLMLPDVHHYEFLSSTLLLGVFLFGLINVLWFRKLVWQSLKEAFYSTHKHIITPLWRLIRSRIVQAILHSPLFRFSLRFMVKPAFWTALVWLVLPFEDISWRDSFTHTIIIFLTINLFINSRVGRNAEEMAADWTVQTWNRYGIRFFTGLFWMVMDFFRAVLEALDRFMYSVDEWLRFRSGENALDLGLKGALGLIWFAVAYVVRFCVNLLIEPQINPIKHFPVVTVSHKLLVPLIPHLAGVLETRMGIEKGWAWTLASTAIFSIPGVFGFLVWELKENWRLYAANRKAGLSPVIVGKHGETMIRFLKPGLHSGALPKLFAKLRRAERKARKTGNWHSLRKHLHALSHFELAIRRFAEREFLALLQAGNWQSEQALAAREIHLATNRVRIFLARDNSPNNDLLIDLELLSGWITGNVHQSDWAGKMPEPKQQALDAAILGLYKSAGVELIGQQIQAAFSPPVQAYDINPRGISVWTDKRLDTEVFYDLTENYTIAPQIVAGNFSRTMPTLERSQLKFSEFQITWRQWVGWWQDYQATPEQPPAPLAPFPVLPKTTKSTFSKILSLFGRGPG